MNKIIIDTLTKNVKWYKIYEITQWDKIFQNVDKKLQKKKLNYAKVSAAELKSLEEKDGNIPLYTTGLFDAKTIEITAKNFINNDEVITIPDGRANIRYINGKFVITDHNKLCKSFDKNIVSTKYIYYFFKNKNIEIQSFYTGAAPQSCDMNKLLNLQIPIPPLEIQNKIVSVLDKFSELEAELGKELQLRKKQYEYYRNKLLSFDKEKEMGGSGFLR